MFPLLLCLISYIKLLGVSQRLSFITYLFTRIHPIAAGASYRGVIAVPYSRIQGRSWTYLRYSNSMIKIIFEKSS
ncbi:hypothetical protein GGR53DRAFT_283976 [Hypoxylon sp. FL1150]|nr:hypothetical protein GGR53DRAFT_283976 [Hypoxylon sp. FL1150]